MGGEGELLLCMGSGETLTLRSSQTCGAEVATQISNTLEYEWHKDASWDPYADMYPSSS